jgi:hypothetical protein
MPLTRPLASQNRSLHGDWGSLLMLIARLLVFGSLGLALLALLVYMITGDLRYRRFGVILLKWTILAGVGFFVVLIGMNIWDAA